MATSILAVVFLAAAFIQSVSAKQTRLLYGDARTLHRCHLAFDYIRYKLSMAQVGALVVNEEGETIEFHNPMLGTTLGQPISALKFDSGELQYYRDTTQTDPDHEIGLLDDVQFEVLGAGNAVRVTITTLQSYSWSKDRPFTLVGEITLRN